MTDVTERDNLDMIRANLQANEITILNAQITSLREALNSSIKFPTPQSCCTPPPFNYCVGCDLQQHKRDCYYFHEEQMMGAHLSICRKTGNECSCEECKNYLSCHDADKIIAKYMREEEQ